MTDYWSQHGGESDWARRGREETIYALLEQTNWDNIFPPEGEGGN